MPLLWLSLAFLGGIALAARLGWPASVWLTLAAVGLALEITRRLVPRFFPVSAQFTRLRSNFSDFVSRLPGWLLPPVSSRWQRSRSGGCAVRPGRRLRRDLARAPGHERRRQGESFSPDADEVERLMYGFSNVICLPDGMSHGHSVGTGTVMRPDTLRGYARQAGFDDIEILPIETDFWRFYRLV